MKQTLVRYKIKPEETQENVRLIERVFQELTAKGPEGVRYMCLRLNDDTFVHFATVESRDGVHPITSLDLSGPSKVASKSGALSSRNPPMRPSLAIIGWSASELGNY